MRSGVRRLVGVGAVAAALLPGTVAAQSVGPSTLTDVPAPVLAVASFVATLAVGGLLLVRYEGFVDRSINSSKERPLLSVVYGAIAYGLVGFGCVYALGQLARLGVGGAVFTTVVVVVVGTVVLSLAGLGFVVVGSLLTELGSGRQPWTGLVVGASVSALVWLALPSGAAVAAWFVVTAVGIGGATRKWIHASEGPAVERAH